jgi:hypothetical protein
MWTPEGWLLLLGISLMLGRNINVGQSKSGMSAFFISISAARDTTPPSFQLVQRFDAFLEIFFSFCRGFRRTLHQREKGRHKKNGRLKRRYNKKESLCSWLVDGDGGE